VATDAVALLAQTILGLHFAGAIAPVEANDSFLISLHSGRAAPGQDACGLPVIPLILRGIDPAGPDHGVGFAEFTFVP
jgi:hypothetical protein